MIINPLMMLILGYLETFIKRNPSKQTVAWTHTTSSGIIKPIIFMESAHAPDGTGQATPLRMCNSDVQYRLTHNHIHQYHTQYKAYHMHHT